MDFSVEKFIHIKAARLNAKHEAQKMLQALQKDTTEVDQAAQKAWDKFEALAVNTAEKSLNRNRDTLDLPVCVLNDSHCLDPIDGSWKNTYRLSKN